ncbi:uncharacterized protein LOC110622911 isoform X2 [Manihot esculenta]|nr:uncharacterized protein LOC110622911 isoform X2 [Manihot esculenta]
MVSLRCLEQLFGIGNGVPNDVPSVGEPKRTFDFSGTCEDALKSILKETSVSDLRMTRSDVLRWDIHPFITHKRACMPKCALEKLKDEISKGTHPNAAALTELIGVVHKNDENGKITVDSGHHNAVTGRIDSDETDAQVMAPEESTNSLPLENKNGMVGGDSHHRNLLPLKRNKSSLDNENPAGEHQEDQGGVGNGDLLLNVKRVKSNTMCISNSTERSFILQNGKRLVEDSSEKLVRVKEKGSCQMERESQIRLAECKSLENGHDNFVATKELGNSHNVGVSADFLNNQCENAGNANRMQSDRSGDGPSQHILVDEVHEAEHILVGVKERGSCQMQRESQIGELAECRSLENGHDKFVATKELGDSHNAGVNADFQHNQSESAGDANKMQSDRSGDGPSHHISVDSLSGLHRDAAVEKLGGMEHLCQEDTSSDGDEYHLRKVDVAMEKSHFLSSQCTLNHVSPTNWTELHLCVKCSKDGQLLVCNAVGCPLVVHKECLGSLPRFDEEGNFYCPFCSYSLAISEYMEAKKKASLARRELSAFIHKQTESSHSKEHNNLNQDGDEDDMSGNVRESESNQTNNGGYAFEVNSQLEKRRGDKQPVEPTVSCSDIKLINQEEDPDVTHAITNVSTGEKEREEMASECLTVGGLERQDQTFANPKCNGDNPMRKDSECFPLNGKQAGVIEKNVLEQQSSDQENISDEGNKENLVSNYSIRFQRREKQYLSPAIPQLRRKKVHWTTEEEEMLKEGVQKFSNVGERAIPWKKILEYGSSVFLNGRTTVDLKDKWRNICKGSPKCK